MEHNLNAIHILEAFYFYLIEKNPYYLTYTNGNEIYFIYKDKETQLPVLVIASSFQVINNTDDLISILSPYINTSNDFIQEIEVKDNEEYSALSEITEDEFLKICFLIKEKSNILNVDFIYNTDKHVGFNYVLFLDKSLHREDLLNPLFFNNNYYLVDDKSIGHYKVIHGKENEKILVTCNPFMFGFYNQENNKNAILFHAKEHESIVFEALTKEFPNNSTVLDNIAVAFLERVNDLSFALKIVVGIFNIQLGNHLQFLDTKESVIVAFEFDKKMMDIIINDFLKFNQLLNDLNKKMSLIGEIDAELKISLVRYDLNELKTVRYVVPKKIELLKLFLEEFIRHYQLNVQLYSDLSFSNEEDNFHMF